MNVVISNEKYLGSDAVIAYPVARRGSSSDSYPLSTLVTERLSTNIIRGISPNDGSFIYNDVNVLTENDTSNIIFFIYGYFFQTTVRDLYQLCASFNNPSGYVHACIKIDSTTSSKFWEMTKVADDSSSSTMDSDSKFKGLAFILSDTNRDLSDDTYKTLCLVKIDSGSGSGTSTTYLINESTKYSYFALTQPYILCEAESVLSNRLNEVPSIGDDPYTQKKLWVQLNYDGNGSAVLRYYYNEHWQIIGSIYK